MLEALLQPCPCECEKHSGELCGTAKARDLQQKKNLTSRCRHSLYLPWMLEKTLAMHESLARLRGSSFQACSSVTLARMMRAWRELHCSVGLSRKRSDS